MLSESRCFMDIKPFYELRNRLYSSAVAGCSIINEDFRLKRAVENFKPLSEANKVFGKLYVMCDKLFSSENTASDLADCISLADALAVTQGTFMDSSETQYSPEYELKNCEPVNVPYSKVNEFIDKIKKNNLRNLSDIDMGLIKDPRILSAFISKCGINHVNFSEFAYSLCRFYGKSIVPLLKKSIDLSNPKETGNQIDYVCSIVGAEENEWYLELTKNEENPQNVRIKAINALALSKENADFLMEMYHTEKGEIKKAVLCAIAVLDPPEAEPIWLKMTESIEKFKMTNIEYIKLSENKICSDFAKKYISYLLDNNNPDKKERYDKFATKCVWKMLANKTDVEELIVTIIASFTSDKELSRYTRYDMLPDFSMIIINNIMNHPDNPAYIELCHNLYARLPHQFTSAEFLTHLKNDPDKAFEMAKNTAYIRRIAIINVLQDLYYSYTDEMYYLNYGIGQSDFHVRPIPVFKEIPESMFEFLTDLSFNKIATILTTEKTMFSILCERISSLFAHFLRNPILLPQDTERLKKYAAEFIFATAHNFPNMHNINILSKYINNEQPEKYKDIIYDYIHFFMTEKKSHYSTAFLINELDSFPMSDSDKLDELKRIKKLYTELIKTAKYPQVAQRELEFVEKFIQKYTK